MDITQLSGFFLAIFPLILVFIGIILFRQSGARMAVIGWIAAILVAVFCFKTDISVALGASAYGILKSFGITISVLFTILMIFIMKEAKALEVISGAVKTVASTKEEQAIFIGIGFGTLVTSLGVVTPSLLPPFLVALGFDPFSAVSVSVMGYNASCSFALLSIPITLPVNLFGLDVNLFTYKICLYLPVLSTLISFAMLYVIGGFASIKKGWRIALASGLTLGVSALLFSIVGVPVMLIGVLSGALTMMALYAMCRKTRKKDAAPAAQPAQSADSSGKNGNLKKFLRAASPWLLLITFALLISIPQISQKLKVLDGTAVSIFGKPVDFDALIQPYPWILLSTLISIPFIGISGGALKKATKTWVKRILQPFLSYSLFFAMAYIMAWSAMSVSDGKLVPSADFNTFNMNMVVASTIAGIFGTSFVYVAAWLGLFGAVVGGSEASSNVMFYPIQKGIADKIGLTDSQFLTTYAAHANAGGITSGITPSKINNAVVTLNEKPELESRVMSKHMLVVLVIILITGILNALFVMWNL